MAWFAPILLWRCDPPWPNCITQRDESAPDHPLVDTVAVLDTVHEAAAAPRRVRTGAGRGFRWPHPPGRTGAAHPAGDDGDLRWVIRRSALCSRTSAHGRPPPAQRSFSMPDVRWLDRTARLLGSADPRPRAWGAPAGARWSSPAPVRPPLGLRQRARCSHRRTRRAAMVAAAPRAKEVAGSQIATIRRRLQDELSGVQIHGGEPDDLPHILSVSVLYVDAEAVQTALDARGYAVGSGSACASRSGQPSHVLAAIGGLTSGNLRIGLPRSGRKPWPASSRRWWKWSQRCANRWGLRTCEPVIGGRGGRHRRPRAGLSASGDRLGAGREPRRTGQPAGAARRRSGGHNRCSSVVPHARLNCSKWTAGPTIGGSWCLPHVRKVDDLSQTSQVMRTRNIHHP